MRDLDQFLGNALQALDEQRDAPILEVRVLDADIVTLRSLDGDGERAKYVRQEVHNAIARRRVTRVILRGGGLRFDVVTSSPTENEPLHAGERMVV
ncbi:MAG: hypothetical protein ACKV2T_29280 [Kofleriaceae bacterium]